ncbi:MAG: hypothetical protein II937_11190, partial [Bacteroidales bacterium]|nr:hypothetical protein [Bacteroidales bacterium]
MEVLRGHRTGETAPPRRYVRTVVRITRFDTEKQINSLFYVGNLAYSKILEVLRGHRTGETAPPRRYVRTVVRITR